jgi:phasin family protein
MNEDDWLKLMSKHKKPKKKSHAGARPAKISVTKNQLESLSITKSVPYRRATQPQPTRSPTMTEQMEKATQSLIQMCDEVNAFARASIDANLKSVTAAAKGWDEGSRSASNLLQENISRLFNAGKTVAEAKSVQDFVALQQELMKDCVDLWMASATRLSEISARTAKDVVEPVAQHVNDAFSRIMQKARAAA